MKDRIYYLGATDAAGVLGLSRWDTPLSIWAEKTRQIVPAALDNEAVELGRELEDYVARRFTKKTGKKVQRVNETLFHPKYPFLGCNLDRRVVGEDAVLECKTASAWKAKEWEGQEIPTEYIIQVTHQLAVTGKKVGYIAVLIGNQDFKWKKIERDEQIIFDLVKKEVYFWNNFVIPKIMPAGIMASDSDTLYRLYPEAIGEVELGDEADKILESLDALEEDKRSLEGTIEKQKNELKAMLKDKEVGFTKNYRITWKTQTRRVVNGELLEAEEPEIYAKYLKLSTSRVFKKYKKENSNGQR